MRFMIVAPESPQLKAIARSIFAELKSAVAAEMDFVVFEDFYARSSYIERRLTKIGIRKFERSYNRRQIEKLEARCEQFRPDFILILCGSNIPTPVQEFFARYRTILWLWDSYRRFAELENFVRKAGEIFCFEYDEAEILSSAYKIRHIICRWVRTRKIIIRRNASVTWTYRL